MSFLWTIIFPRNSKELYYVAYVMQQMFLQKALK